MSDAWWWLLSVLVLAAVLRWLVVRRPSSRYGRSRYGGPGVVGRRAAVGSDHEDDDGTLGAASRRVNERGERVDHDADVDLRDDRGLEPGQREQRDGA